MNMEYIARFGERGIAVNILGQLRSHYVARGQYDPARMRLLNDGIVLRDVPESLLAKIAGRTKARYETIPAFGA